MIGNYQYWKCYMINHSNILLQVISRVCRSTIVPGLEGMSGPKRTAAVATQSVTLGDHLVAVTTNTTVMDITVIEEFQQPNNSDKKDLHFFYTTPL